jgi:hypothetical protein
MEISYIIPAAGADVFMHSPCNKKRRIFMHPWIVALFYEVKINRAALGVFYIESMQSRPKQ